MLANQMKGKQSGNFLCNHSKICVPAPASCLNLQKKPCTITINDIKTKMCWKSMEFRFQCGIACTISYSLVQVNIILTPPNHVPFIARKQFSNNFYNSQSTSPKLTFLKNCSEICLRSPFFDQHQKKSNFHYTRSIN